ncbi:unnamed protein product, partial [Amoebophrya sp. A120]
KRVGLLWREAEVQRQIAEMIAKHFVVLIDEGDTILRSKLLQHLPTGEKQAYLPYVVEEVVNVWRDLFRFAQNSLLALVVANEHA